MSYKNKNDSEIRIDENSHKAVPTMWKRFKNALVAVVMGIVLVQIIWFNAFVAWLDDPLFIGFLLFCAIMGGWKGQKFIQTVDKEIGHWKFW